MTRERRIDLYAHEVRAILEGRQTQLRRIIKPQPDEDGLSRVIATSERHDTDARVYRSRYGKTGDRLWAREQWAVGHDYDSWSPRNIPWLPVGRRHYAATEDRGGLMWRSPIHMPRWASRLTLEIASVRVQRLQDISEADAEAEGAVRALNDSIGDNWCARESFAALWEYIRGPGSWDANPWVWAIEFRRVNS